MHGNTDNNFCIYLIEAIGKYWYIFMKEKHNRKQSRRSDKDSVKEAEVREEEIKEAPVKELAPKDILQEKEKSSAAEQDAAEKEKPSAAEQKTAEKESQTEEKSEAAQEPDYYDDDTDYYDDDSRNGAEHHDEPVGLDPRENVVHWPPPWLASEGCPPLAAGAGASTMSHRTV